jgi:hypothetical protein
LLHYARKDDNIVSDYCELRSKFSLLTEEGNKITVVVTVILFPSSENFWNNQSNATHTQFALYLKLAKATIANFVQIFCC